MELLTQLTGKQYPDVLKDAERMATALGATSDPTLCPLCFIDFSMVIMLNQSFKLRLRADCHALFDGCLSMLCTWYKLFPEDELRRILVRNIASCSVSRHRLDNRDAEVAYSMVFYTTAGGILLAALDIGDRAPGTRALSNKNFSDKLGRWPSSVGQLFPLGEEATVLALLEFAETFSCPAPMTVLRQMLILARPIVWPIFTTAVNRRRLMFILITLLVPAMRKDAPTWLFQREAGAGSIAAGFLTEIRAGPDAIPREREQFVAGDTEILYKAVTYALNRVPENGAEEFRELAIWSMLLYHTLPAGHKLPPPKRAQRWADEIMKTTKPSLGLAMHMSLSRLANLRACSWCGVSALRNDDGKALSSCAGCKLLRYCSKDCQKRHWKCEGERLPHKAICPILRRLDVSSYASGESAAFAEAFKKVEPDFTKDEMETLKDWISETRRALGESPLVFDKKAKDRAPLASS